MHIAIAGAGLVGAGWTIVFARAGETVKLYDVSEQTRQNLRDDIAARLRDLKQFELVDDPDSILARIEICESLEAAVEGAKYVQESVPERVPVKQEMSARLSRLIGPETVVGSSTSGIPASAFTEDIANRERFLVAHPVNPPYLVPVVEIVPAPWTSQEAVDVAMSTMVAVGQSPILVRREIEGFVLNRLQGVLLREAWALFEEGYASAEDIDKTVREGLGLRWSFIGPFETIDLNAPAGVREYAEVLGPLYHSIDASRSDPKPWSEQLIGNVESERRKLVPSQGLAARRAWRDRRLMALAAHKARQES